jgi:hypothetical protein
MTPLDDGFFVSIKGPLTFQLRDAQSGHSTSSLDASLPPICHACDDASALRCPELALL